MKKKLLAGIIAGVMTLSMAGSVSAAVIDGGDMQNPYEIEYDRYGNATMTSYDEENMVNPVVEYKTVKEAARKAGFILKITSGIKGYKQTEVSLIDKKIFQICYRQKKGKNRNEITIRKAKGKGDISGDYNTWAMTATASVNGKKVKMKGNKKAVSVATWRSGRYTYSVTFSRPVRLKTMTSLVKKIK